MNKLLISILVLISSFSFSNEKFTIIEDQARLPILTPDLAERKVRKLRLENGLEVYLISDPKTDLSGAMLSVNVGSWDEPEEHPGIAHYLEHLLFLGTKKYPEESGYQRYITEHGGTTNAFTTNSYTSYLFSVRNNAFEEALDRFAHFFVEPLFNPSGIARELNAIDQEYAKNLENDDVRLTFVDKALGNPKHPYVRFSMGNRNSLTHVSRQTLIDWYKQHYSANLMHLIVYSNLPLDKLQELVLEDFSAVSNANSKPFKSELPILSNAYKGKIIYVEPIQNRRNLTMLWELPEKFSEMKDSQPDKLVCYVLGHEGSESLLAELKRQNFAEKLECGKVKLSSNNSLFYLDIGLTEKGVKNVNDVIQLTFHTIDNFKEKGAKQYLYDELRRTEIINYQYQPREDVFTYLMRNAQWMVDEDLSTYPEKTLIVQTFDQKDITSLLQELTPDAAHIYLLAPASLTQVKYDQKEKWANVDYTIIPVAEKTFLNWSNHTSNGNIDLPVPNRFIANDLRMVSKEEAASNRLIPPHTTVMNNEKGLIYFVQDNKFNVPEVYWHFNIKTPFIEMGVPSKVVLGDLYVKALTEELKGFSYPASLAGLRFDIIRSLNGIDINVYGYSDNAVHLFEEIVKKLHNVHPTEEEFRIYKDSLSLEYQNTAKKPPLDQAIEMMKSVIFKRYTTSSEKALAINHVTYEKFKDYLFHMFDQIYVEGLLYGNVAKEEVKEPVDNLMNVFSTSMPYPKEKQQKREVIILPENEGPFYWEASTKAQGNAAMLILQHPHADMKGRSAQQVLMQGIEEPFYSRLRTQQQTGYLVFSTGEEIERQLFDIFAVQSNTHNVRDLLSRFELFLEQTQQELTEEISEERFTTIKNSLIDMLEHPAKNIQEMGALIEKIAFEYEDFYWIEKRIDSMKNLTYDEFLQLSRAALSKNNKRRLGILLKGVVPETVLDYTPLYNSSKLKEMSTFKSGRMQKRNN